MKVKSYQECKHEALTHASFNECIQNLDLPIGVHPENIHAMVDIYLQQPQKIHEQKENEVDLLAELARRAVQDELQKHFTASFENADLFLRVWVVAASDELEEEELQGSRLCQVKEVLAYCLYKPDGSVCFRAGRVGGTDDLEFQVDSGDLVYIQAEEHSVVGTLSPHLAREVEASVTLDLHTSSTVA